MLKNFITITLLYCSLFADTFTGANKAYKSGDIKMAIKLYKELARGGSDEANFKLGIIYYKGKGIKKDIQKAIYYFEKASLYDHKKAQYNIFLDS